MASNLRFSRALNQSKPVNLRFGAGTPALPTYNIDLAATIAAPRLTASLHQPQQLRLNATIPVLRLTASLQFANPVRLAATMPTPTLAAALQFSKPQEIRLLAAIPAPILTALLKPINEVRISATMPTPSLAAFLFPLQTLKLQATTDIPSMTALINYDNAVFRGVVSIKSSGWQPARSIVVKKEDFSQTPVKLPMEKRSVWHAAKGVEKTTQLSFYEASKSARQSSNSWQSARQIGTSTASLYRELSKSSRSMEGDWQEATTLSNPVSSAWVQLLHLPNSIESRGGIALSIGVALKSFSTNALPLKINNLSQWQGARKPPPGRYFIAAPPPVAQNCYIVPKGSAVALRFKKAYSASKNIRFACDHATPPTVTTIAIPVRRAYIVINDLSLTRVDGNYDLPVNNLSINIDISSWTWSFSASMHASALPMIEPDSVGNPTILRATINGAHYLLIAETVKRDRTFGKANINVTGRGLSAMLDAPYSPARSFSNTQERTAQQLMQDALTINGVALDWAIDWRIDDWLVPAGAFSHSGSYMNALTIIANAAGAFIQPDPINQVIRVRHKFPIKPWEFNLATPEIELPSSVIIKESISWNKKPDYNAVYISGTSASGILGLVKKTGTAGDLLAPMVTDALITSAVAARQRGLTVLADTGKTATYSLSLPVLAETGIIEPGTSVRYKDDKDIIGIVQGVSFSSESDKRTARQTIEVLTYV